MQDKAKPGNDNTIHPGYQGVTVEVFHYVASKYD